MKTLILSLFLLISLSNLSFSQSAKKEFHVIYVDWDGWGRTSRECKGFGLCKFASCTFCCTEEGVIVNCNNKNIIPNSGIANIDKETKEGILTIALNPNFAEQSNAINQKSTLFIDENLRFENLTIIKDDYLYDASVGRNGGYLVKIKMD